MNLSESRTKRVSILRALRQLAMNVNTGAYFVRRGAIVWETFPWKRYPRAIAITYADGSFAPSDDVHVSDFAIHAGTFLEMNEENPEVDDELMNEMLLDVESIVYDLEPMKHPETGNTLAYFVDRGDREVWRAHGWYDTSIHVQGVTATFRLKY